MLTPSQHAAPIPDHLEAGTRQRDVSLIAQVNEDRPPIEFTSKRRDATLMARADNDAVTETADLLRAPANAWRLFESLKQAREVERFEREPSHWVGLHTPWQVGARDACRSSGLPR